MVLGLSPGCSYLYSISSYRLSFACVASYFVFEGVSRVFPLCPERHATIFQDSFKRYNKGALFTKFSYGFLYLTQFALMKKSALRRRRAPRRALAVASIRSLPFLQYLSHQVISLPAATNTITYNVSTLASDLSSTRLVKLTSVVCRFYPIQLAPATGIIISAQLFIFDTSTGTALPVSVPRPLSYTNPVVLRGRFNRIDGWLPAGSANLAFQFQFWTNAVTPNVVVDIESRFQLAQDTLI
jgi:hypothetical protein